MSDKAAAAKARFMKYVQVDVSGGCWRFCGSRAITGYCNFFYNGSTHLAHRAALLVFDVVKQLDPTKQVAHSCGNRDCVNPSHLSEKTREENNGADKRLHGTDQSGERCHFSKLTWDAVRDIRKRSECEKLIDIASRYGISPSTVSSIVRGKTWKE